jgi:hypothetical protein
LTTDLYLRIEGDPNFEPGQIEVQDEVVVLLQQIEMVLFTTKGDILGAPNLGVDLERLLWSLTVSEGVIKSAIYNQIANYCPLSRKYNVDIDVKIYKGTERDIGVVDIIVDGARKTGMIIS